MSFVRFTEFTEIQRTIERNYGKEKEISSKEESYGEEKAQNYKKDVEEKVS